MNLEPKINIINNFIEENISHFEEYTKDLEPKKSNKEKLDNIFRKYI